MGTLGTFDVQGAEAEQSCAEVVTVALDAGANLFDSSPMYGHAERVLGRVLRGRRARAIVATKIWAHSVPDARAQVTRGLGFFQGHVEIYQIHNLVRWETVLPVLEESKSQGQILAIGITPYAHSAYRVMREIMELGRVDTIQVPYHVADRLAEQELLPLAQELDLGVIVMQPLGAGELVRREPSRAEWNALRLERFGVETWSQALLKWIVSEPRVHVAIPATSKVAHMAQNARAGDPPWFDPDTREAIAHWVASQS
jgi:aryl-alcohol dehydrogenase-like predicted oxidoreductase